MSARGGNYKFKSLQVYGSTEYLSNNQFLYRRVFDSSEIQFIYFELYFHNKLFDEETWSTTVCLTCTSLHDNKNICTFNKDIIVNKEEEHIRVSHSWGTPEGGWWKKGSYKVEAFIEGKLLGTEALFYITECGMVTKKKNPFFSINNIRLFEGDGEARNKSKRDYCVGFKNKECRYLYTEMTLDSHMSQEISFPLELFFYYYNDRGQLKGLQVYFSLITDKKQKIVISPSWGTNEGDYWVQGNYTIKIVFMNELIASVPFQVGEQVIPLTNENRLYSDNSMDEPLSLTDIKPTFEEAKAKLDALIGLQTVKKQVEDLAKYLQFVQIRQSIGLAEEKPKLHLVFTGNPGTGKTTVARMLSTIYHSLGLLKSDTLTEVGRAELVGDFIGQTAPKVDKLLKQATGGVLFIDEAYALTSRGSDKDFGPEVVERLLKELDDNPAIAIIFAGYPAEMEQFLSSNPGLRSRLPNVIHFPDYSPNELIDVGQFSCTKQGVSLDEEAHKALLHHIVEVYRTRDKSFGNARYMNGIIREAKQNLALRVMQQTDLEYLKKNPKEISTIKVQDVEVLFQRKKSAHFTLPIDEALYDEAMMSLNNMVGLASLKKEIFDLAKLVRYYREIGKDIGKAFSLHSVFVGNPGTGKTTLARIFAQIFKSLGILEKGHLVECSRKDLVAGYIGQTALKTSEVISQAKGGVLFIDEAYSLTSHDTGTDFGKEVVETLLKRMEDERGEFIVIAAGYPDEMKQFLETNPGLKSRFDKSYVFEDYSQIEMMAIALKMIKNEGLSLDAEAEIKIAAQIDILLKRKDQYFGNARDLRKLVQESCLQHHLRMASIDKSYRTEEMMKTISAHDIISLFDSTNLKSAKSRIGFSLE